jgi:hypothetical protein
MGLFKGLKLVTPALTIKSFSDDLHKKQLSRKVKLRAPFFNDGGVIVGAPIFKESANEAFTRQSSNMLKMATLCVTDSSQASYSVGHRAWLNWCLSTNVDSSLEIVHSAYIPNSYGFQVHMLATFLGFLATDLKVSPATIHVYKHGVRDYFRKMHKDLNFFNHELLDRIRGAISIDWNANHEKYQTRRLPFTLDMLQTGIQTIWCQHIPTGKIITMAIKMGLCLLARASELMFSLEEHFIRSVDVIFSIIVKKTSNRISIKASDAFLYTDKCLYTLIGVTVTIRSAKNDQVGNGHNTYWDVRELSKTCIFDIVTDMFEWAAYARPPDELPFLSYFGSMNESDNFFLKYETLLAAIKNAALACNFDPAKFGCHSLRIGGASILAAAGYPNHYIQKQGRWKSLAFLTYIQWSIKSMENALAAIVNPLHFSNLDLIRLHPGAHASTPAYLF